MFEFLPTPVDHPAVARHIGFDAADLAATPGNAQARAEGPMLLIGGALPLPMYLNGYLVQSWDLSEPEQVKKGAIAAFDRAGYLVRQVNDEFLKIRADQRFTDQGRAEAQRKAYNDKWAAPLSAMLEAFDGQFRTLEKNLMRACQPAPIAASDAAAAVLDSEYRAVVRGMFAGQASAERLRAQHLFQVQRDEPGNAVVRAVLRADAAASGLAKGDHGRLLLAAGVQDDQEAIRSVWSAAAALDAAGYLLHWGTQRLAKACGQEQQAFALAADAAINQAPARASVRRWLDLLVSDAAGLRLSVKEEA